MSDGAFGVLSAMVAAMELPSRRGALWVACGGALGLVYSVINRLFDLSTGFGTLPSSLAPFHTFVDLVLPVIIGLLLGVLVHYIQVRAALAEAERRRADDLRTRLQHVERDQAVWVLAASVLHEVKNPLHALGLLLDDLATADGEAERGRLLERSRVHVQRIAERLADLRQLSGGLPDLSMVRVADLARHVASEISPLAQNEGIALSVVASGELEARCDPAYVRVILENLIENAFDAMRSNGARGTIAIDVGAGDGHLRVRVQDEGPGLGETERANLFQPLRSSKHGGMGLGLSISRKLARAMGGDVRYDDHGRGAFVLELPEEASAA
jgi:signal transduction histidine kinase